MKKIYISFQDTPRIYVNQPPPKGFPFIENPDLSRVKGIPMQEWTLAHLTPTPFWKEPRLYVLIAIGALITLLLWNV